MSVKTALKRMMLDNPSFTPPRLFKWTDEEFDELLIAPPSDEHRDGCRIRDPQWTYSEALFPMTAPSRRSLNFRIPFDLMQPGREPLVRSVKRYIVACMFWPLADSLDLGSLRKRLRLFSYVAELIHNGRFAGAERFSDVRLDQLAEALPDILSGRRGALRGGIAYVRELQTYGKIGAVHDYFAADACHGPIVVADIQERTFPHGDDLEAKPCGTKGTYLPFPDEYLAEAGRRWNFYVAEIGPNLARIAADWQYFSTPGDLATRTKVWGGRSGHLHPSSLKRPLAERQRRYLAEFEWRSSDGTPLREIPFPCDGLVFPPSSFTQLVKLISLHQSAIFQISALFSAGRQGEILTISRPHIEATIDETEAGDYQLVSRLVRKSSDRSAGSPTDWPVPTELLPWLSNQAQVSAALHRKPSPYIWVGLNSNSFGHSRMEPHYLVKNFPIHHGLEHLLGDHPNAHSHRFRKSLVRLAVLALNRAPTIIMMILGHRDIASSLAYILSDPDIRGDLRTMLGDHRVEIALEVGEALDECAGPGAKSLTERREQYFSDAKVPANERVQRRRQREFIAAMLMDGGVDIKLIFPGVVCIKPLEASGKCRRRGRAPNPALCQSDCKYRLDLPSRKPHVRGIIEDLLDDLDDPMVAASEHVAWWKAELLDHLNIFRDIRAEYAEDDRVKRALGGLL